MDRYGRPRSSHEKKDEIYEVLKPSEVRALALAPIDEVKRWVRISCVIPNKIGGEMQSFYEDICVLSHRLTLNVAIYLDDQ